MMKAMWINATYAAVVVFVVLLSSGCATGSVSDRKMARYRPVTDDRNVAAWMRPQAGATGIGQAAVAASTNQPAEAAWSRPLRKGDRMILYLGSIPKPEERPDVIDDTGCINLPHIGPLRLEGKTTSEAEAAIQKAYIDGGYYQNITASIVAQEDQYYIGGEVRRPGNYPLRGEVTLLQAIATAGGYTEFAKAREVQINRMEKAGQKTLMYDAQKIMDGKEKDPLIKPGDLITVGRRWFI